MEIENQRKTNYSQVEDEALVKAWLHISGDAVVGRDQKSTKLWLLIRLNNNMVKLRDHYKQNQCNFVSSSLSIARKLLKDSPKWNDHVLVRNTSKGCKKPSNPQSQAIDLDDLGTPSTPSTPCSIPLDEFKSMDHEHNEVRPAEGRRKAKAKRKNEWRDEESTLYLKSINETLAQTAIIEKEKLETKKKSEEEK
ncbi:hypothetical protein RHGRI_000200 [Rhododendron griersonianum]|uniref:No apical meristem-associated C-terminal domain-containing protein n=1 Tax=Rhododendron griersonianum TaxID=479676 RepID=A0AAV6LIQ0_9ERIC|nr:hypothetical protein RHGRI_000200 [Rhododendron griersonianum]